MVEPTNTRAKTRRCKQIPSVRSVLQAADGVAWAAQQIVVSKKSLEHLGE